jgi:hypothetical protein
MFFYGFVNLPYTFKPAGKYDEVAGPETYGSLSGGSVGYRNFTFEYEACFCLGVIPVEFAFLTSPGGPLFAVGGLLIVGLFYYDIVYC